MLYDFICINCKKQKINKRKYLSVYCNYCYWKLFKSGVISKTQNTADSIVQFSEQQLNILTGLMLGDGNIFKRKNVNGRGYLQVDRSIKDLDYLTYQFSIFEQFITNSGIYIYDQFNKDTNKTHKKCKFLSQTHALFTDFYNKWYMNDIKCVPLDLKLNTEIIVP